MNIYLGNIRYGELFVINNIKYIRLAKKQGGYVCTRLSCNPDITWFSHSVKVDHRLGVM